MGGPARPHSYSHILKINKWSQFTKILGVHHLMFSPPLLLLGRVVHFIFSWPNVRVQCQQLKKFCFVFLHIGTTDVSWLRAIEWVVAGNVSCFNANTFLLGKFCCGTNKCIDLPKYISEKGALSGDGAYWEHLWLWILFLKIFISH